MFLLHSDSEHDHTFGSRRVVDQISFAKEKREGERRKKEGEAFVYSILRHLSSIQSSRKLLEVSRRVPRVLAFASLSVLHVGDSPLTRDLFSRSRRKESELSGTFLFSCYLVLLFLPKKTLIFVNTRETPQGIYHHSKHVK